jgi:bifunctional ADP-heptose synthase (sugar kinase/adenylyltransferase)
VEVTRLQKLMRQFLGCRIAVLGDFFLDKYLDVDPALAEVSVETGKTAHQVAAIRYSPGAAGTVVNNLAALGTGELHLFGITGDDGEGYELRKALQKLGCKTEGLLTLPERFTPTYLKPRDCCKPHLSGEHERYDTKNRQQMPVDVQDRVLERFECLLPQIDAVTIQDQVDEEECGIVTTKVRERLAEFADRYPEKIFWADSRCRINLFRNMIIKVNAHEAVKGAFPPGADDANDKIVTQAMAQLRRRTGKPVFITAGRRGIWISDPEPTLVRGVRVPEPTDPTGAGDSATAAGVLALCAGASLPEAALMANLVASITVQQLATTGTASPNQIGPRLEMWLSQG